ncbi:hypothetical protein GIB67_023505 [Kingdonia uniflora]|uniref:Chromo domain-containing protein n=1 Tax=Kingdonia uniflora TaxID=39325 RepID=A0A7J7PAP5_9MAGN|nr:hypothetical protein GIB67_023505 [Kingdonia uniflora]
MRNNSISGELPSSLQNCTVTDHGSWDNKLSGSIPKWIGKSMLNLAVLGLRFNKFKGEIPGELCNITSLQILDVAHNYLSGTIPRCFSNLSAKATKKGTNFEIYNSVTSRFDEKILLGSKGLLREYTHNTLKLVTIMDLSYNSLSGEIPQEITSLLGLRQLLLSNNHFTGKIPEKIDDMVLLENLNLSRNQLTGVIPQSISRLTSLNQLNLSYNNLSGEIPTGPQLQTFTESSYCGTPLLKKSNGNGFGETPNTQAQDSDEYDLMEQFYVTVGPGFVIVTHLLKSMVSSKSNTVPKDDSSTEVGDTNADVAVVSGDFTEGEKVLAYHGPCVYEAKVQKVEFRKKEWKYFVHYLGWNKNWDEWVGADRLMKITPENIEKQEALNKKAPDKNFKSGRSAQNKPKSSTEAKVDKEDLRNNVARGKKRKGESVTEDKDTASMEKHVKIEIPSTLKKQLVDDWEFVTQLGKFVKLPRSPSVDDILKKYLDYKSKKDGMIGETIAEIMKGLRCYFDKALPAMLLYKKEQQQYQETIKDNISPSAVYGAEHLLRLFVKLPELLAYANIEEETLTRLQQKLLDFLKFLQKNQSIFFLSTYTNGGSKNAEGSSRGDD